jgi:dolichol-phosphate mannosyltransferase
MTPTGSDGPAADRPAFGRRCNLAVARYRPRRLNAARPRDRSPSAEGEPTPSAPEISVILPTLNERECLERLHPRIERALRPYRAEIVVVDDNSPDGTAELVREITSSVPYRLVSRPFRLGLSSAILSGFERARGEIFVVMDADGSHPPETIPHLVEPVASGRAEFALASRHTYGGMDLGLSQLRRIVSWGATRLARPLVRVADPMSGFFALHRRILTRGVLRPCGYKIGLEILVKCTPAPVVEVPFRFLPRISGRSKLDHMQMGSYLRHLGRLYSWELSRAFRWG